MKPGTLREVTEWARGNGAAHNFIEWAEEVLDGGGDWPEFNQYEDADIWRIWIADHIPLSRLEPLEMHLDVDWCVREAVAERIDPARLEPLEMHRDMYWGVRAAVAKRIDPSRLEPLKMYRDKNDYVRAIAAERLKTWKEKQNG